MSLRPNLLRWCKAERKFDPYICTKDSTVRDRLVDFILPYLNDPTHVSYPVKQSAQLKSLAEYFFTTQKVGNLAKLLFGFETWKAAQPTLNELYLKDVPPVEVANRLLHAALYVFFEVMSEDVFVSIVAFYVNTRKDQRWCEKVLSLCNKQSPLDLSLWFTDVIWLYIDTYLCSKWWYFYD